MKIQDYKKLNFKRSKYGNVRKTLYGLTFDSKREADHYLILREKMNRGAISDLTTQPKFVLQLPFTDNQGNHHRAIEYWGDFQYYDKEAKVWVVEDVKGMKTEVYKIKKKLFLYSNPELEFREV